MYCWRLHTVCGVNLSVHFKLPCFPNLICLGFIHEKGTFLVFTFSWSQRKSISLSFSFSLACIYCWFEPFKHVFIMSFIYSLIDWFINSWGLSYLWAACTSSLSFLFFIFTVFNFQSCCCNNYFDIFENKCLLMDIGLAYWQLFIESTIPVWTIPGHTFQTIYL